MRPTFIIGYKRSGTTILRLILDSHNEIACPPETYLLKHFCNIVKDERCMNALNMITDQPLDRLSWSINNVFQSYAHEKNKYWWAEKTTENINLMPEIYKLFDEDCLFLCIVRHPLDVVYSVKELHPEKDLVDIIKDWKEKTISMLDFIDKHPKNCLLVKYEDLTVDTEITIKEICKFLDVKLDKRMWNPYKVSHDFLYDDPKIHNYESIELNTGNYKKWDKAVINRLIQVCPVLLAEFGYHV